ncbi:expressed unknown protein [Seminavis robusta]|uniref:LRRK2 ARM repeat domain-containing protein n=1 Tax=Seminavis robusta TaxID=568900 RepID=A0A9N8HAW2_9STRA|nr:expressed unknown protein [Seminavis robusta]|eukprot:Sro312_g114530.1 n/a (292) ;mRNA; r:20212-21087
MRTPEPTSKRIRVSPKALDNDEAAPVQDLTGRSCFGLKREDDEDSNTSIATATQCIAPKLDKIPHLFIVDLQKGSTDDVVAALKQISHLVNAKDSDNPSDPAVKNWKEMQQLGPMTLVVLCMQKWPKAQSIQVWSCIALANMLDVSYSCGGGRAAMANSGGVEAVLSALKTFLDSAQLQSEALRALQNFFTCKQSDGESKVVLANFAGRFIELEGISLVVQTTKRFHDNVDLLFASCGLLYNLSLLEKHHDELVKHGAVEAVASIQKRHFGNEELKKEAEEFLAKMFTKKT